MEGNIKENTTAIKNMAKEHLFGQMAVDIKVVG